MLCLFDIDGTLVDTGGAGMAALRSTAMQVFGLQSPPLDLAGSTDLGIVSEMCEHFGVVPDVPMLQHFFGLYHDLLAVNLSSGEFSGRLLPGLPGLLADLSAAGGVKIGLLTGNTMQGAALKLEHFGVGGYFSFGAYGDDAADRNALGPVALERARTTLGREFFPHETWVIGDTPKDIACARAFGAKCLAVGTGIFSTDQLREHDPDLAVDSLEGVLERLL